MINNLKKILHGGGRPYKLCIISCFFILIFAFSLSFTFTIRTADADVCFLPESDNCGSANEIPYCEGDACSGEHNLPPRPIIPDPDQKPDENCPDNCYSSEEVAQNARDLGDYDSYYVSGNCYCMKKSCSGSSYIEHKGFGWNCSGLCSDTKSLNYNKYTGCTEKQCESPSSTTCQEDECHTCEETAFYSGDTPCKESTAKDPYCDTGDSDKIDSSIKCYSTYTKHCGTGTCYKVPPQPTCGAHEYLSHAGGKCSCECNEGYEKKNGVCVEDKKDTCLTIYVKCHHAKDLIDFYRGSALPENDYTYLYPEEDNNLNNLYSKFCVESVEFYTNEESAIGNENGIPLKLTKSFVPEKDVYAFQNCNISNTSAEGYIKVKSYPSFNEKASNKECGMTNDKFDYQGFVNQNGDSVIIKKITTGNSATSEYIDMYPLVELQAVAPNSNPKDAYIIINRRLPDKLGIHAHWMYMKSRTYISSTSWEAQDDVEIFGNNHSNPKLSIEELNAITVDEPVLNKQTNNLQTENNNCLSRYIYKNTDDGEKIVKDFYEVSDEETTSRHIYADNSYILYAILDDIEIHDDGIYSEWYVRFLANEMLYFYDPTHTQTIKRRCYISPNACSRASGLNGCNITSRSHC